MIEKTLHAANIAAAFGVVATTADLTLFGGLGTTLSAALSGRAIWVDLDSGGKETAKSIAKAMQTALGNMHLTDDNRILLRQMIEAFPPSNDDFMAGNMDAATVANILATRLDEHATDPAHKSADLRNKFVQVVTASLTPVLQDAIAKAQQQGEMLSELLKRLDATGKTDALREAGITENAIIRMAERVGTETDDVGKAWDALQETFFQALHLQQNISSLGNDEAFVDKVLRRTAALAAQGDFQTAHSSVDDAIAQEEADSYRRKKRLLETGLEVAQIARDAKVAAGRIEALLRLGHVGDELFAALCEKQDEWYVKGRDGGLAFEAEVAILLAKTSVGIAQTADQNGTALNDFGNALRTLGERESGTARLEEAVTAHRDALTERTRERVPLYWAMTQNNLGNALATLGERESGTARLEEALTAYRDALTEYTRERVPLDWAMTQNNLGNALKILGERESGTARLEEAVTAHRDALTERTRERVPRDWAMTQNNLGNALATLGARESGTARLEEAVTAYRDALTEFSRERVPLQWAMTQNNLGNALQTLGERESGTARLEEAVTAYRDSLTERTRERVPQDWAMTQNNLGKALRTLGERESGTARLEDAVTAHRDALKEHTRERVPLQWATTQNNLGNALATLGARESGTARLEEAVTAYRDAMKEYSRERVPLDWAMTQFNLSFVIAVLATRNGSMLTLQEARDCAKAALAVYQDTGAIYYIDLSDRRVSTLEDTLRRFGT